MENYRYSYKKKSRYGHIFKAFFRIVVYVSAAYLWLTMIPNHQLYAIANGVMILGSIVIALCIQAYVINYFLNVLRGRYKWARLMFRK